MKGRLTVRTAMLMLLIGLCVAIPSLATPELLSVVATAGPGAGSGLWTWLAYEDGQVWVVGSSFWQVPWANRDISVVGIAIQDDQARRAALLYADGQVWEADLGGYFTRVMQIERPGSTARATGIASIYYGICLLVSYEDGQLWLFDQGAYSRAPQFERPNPTSAIGEPEDSHVPVVIPNPSQGGCQISLRVQVQGRVSVNILDATGRIVRRLLDGPHPAGEYSLKWDGKDDAGRELPAGVYFTHVTTGQGTATGRVVLAR
jgi:hypothetical protein